MKKLNEPQLKFFKKYLWERYPEYFRDPLEGLDILDLADKMLECCNIDISLSITQHVFEYMGLKKLVSYICGHLKRSKIPRHMLLTRRHGAMITKLLVVVHDIFMAYYLLFLTF